MPAINPFFGNIEDLFSNNYNKTSTHFFTVNDCLKDQIWKKYVTNKPANISQLKEYFKQHNLIEYFKNEISFFNSYGLNFKLIIFYDEINWQIENTNIYIVNFYQEISEYKYEIDIYDKLTFQEHLRDIQGEDMIMNKPLTYSTTELEGYLSDMCQRSKKPVGRAIFPGDVDLILYDYNEAKLLVEFKKHTPYGNIEFDKQSYKQYWYKDKKKYTGLSVLSKSLDLAHFYNVIYSTNKNEFNKIKIEKINSTNLDLTDSFSYQINDPKQEISKIVKKMVK